jgi:hypothetical protein
MQSWYPRLVGATRQALHFVDAARVVGFRVVAAAL